MYIGSSRQLGTKLRSRDRLDHKAQLRKESSSGAKTIEDNVSEDESCKMEHCKCSKELLSSKGCAS